jgi:hypothetical protein
LDPPLWASCCSAHVGGKDMGCWMERKKTGFLSVLQEDTEGIDRRLPRDSMTLSSCLRTAFCHGLLFFAGVPSANMTSSFSGC